MEANDGNVPSGKIAAEAVGVQRENGHPGAVPISADGGSATMPVMSPADIFHALSLAKGPTPADITPTPPTPLTVPYFAPFNQEFALLMRFPVPGVGDQFFLCSATAISDFHLLSAGHCVYNHDPLGVSKTATLTINPPAKSTAVAPSPSKLLEGSNSTATVKINGPAPNGGVDVPLSSSNTHARVPATVHIKAGSSSPAVTVTTPPVSATTTATIKAIFSGVAKSGTLTIVNASYSATNKGRDCHDSCPCFL